MTGSAAPFRETISEGFALARTQRVFKTTMLVTAVIILSKVSGFVRDMILANYFGTGIANDAYVSAYSLFYLPVLLFNSCISATLIPLYVQEREQRGLDRSNHFASNTINLFALAALVIAALLFALARPLVRIVYVGFDPMKAAEDFVDASVQIDHLKGGGKGELRQTKELAVITRTEGVVWIKHCIYGN